jgi:uncharacterized protein (DUF433 family)
MAASKSVQKQNGVVVFAKTAVEVSILFNYLKAGKSTETFLEDYSPVTLEQVLDVLELAEEQLYSIASTH